MKTNARAFELRRKLFDLVNEFKDLQLPTRDGDGDFDARLEASGQIDTAACALATVYQQLGDVFTDVTQDAKDHRFAITLKTDF